MYDVSVIISGCPPGQRSVTWYLPSGEVLRKHLEVGSISSWLVDPERLLTVSLSQFLKTPLYDRPGDSRTPGLDLQVGLLPAC